MREVVNSLAVREPVFACSGEPARIFVALRAGGGGRALTARFSYRCGAYRARSRRPSTFRRYTNRLPRSNHRRRNRFSWMDRRWLDHLVRPKNFTPTVRFWGWVDPPLYPRLSAHLPCDSLTQVGLILYLYLCGAPFFVKPKFSNFCVITFGLRNSLANAEGRW